MDPPRKSGNINSEPDSNQKHDTSEPSKMELSDQDNCTARKRTRPAGQESKNEVKLYPQTGYSSGEIMEQEESYSRGRSMTKKQNKRPSQEKPRQASLGLNSDEPIKKKMKLWGNESHSKECVSEIPIQTSSNCVKSVVQPRRHSESGINPRRRSKSPKERRKGSRGRSKTRKVRDKTVMPSTKSCSEQRTASKIPAQESTSSILVPELEPLSIPPPKQPANPAADLEPVSNPSLESQQNRKEGDGLDRSLKELHLK